MLPSKKREDWRSLKLLQRQFNPRAVLIIYSWKKKVVVSQEIFFRKAMFQNLAEKRDERKKAYTLLPHNTFLPRVSFSSLVWNFYPYYIPLRRFPKRCFLPSALQLSWKNKHEREKESPQPPSPPSVVSLPEQRSEEQLGSCSLSGDPSCVLRDSRTKNALIVLLGFDRVPQMIGSPLIGR